jgi:hypothetical protein
VDSFIRHPVSRPHEPCTVHARCPHSPVECMHTERQPRQRLQDGSMSRPPQDRATVRAGEAGRGTADDPRFRPQASGHVPHPRRLGESCAALPALYHLPVPRPSPGPSPTVT